MFPRSFLRGGLAGVLLGAGIGIAAFSTLAWLLIAIPLVVAGIAVAIRPPERRGGTGIADVPFRAMAIDRSADPLGGDDEALLTGTVTVPGDVARDVMLRLPMSDEQVRRAASGQEVRIPARDVPAPGDTVSPSFSGRPPAQAALSGAVTLAVALTVLTTVPGHVFALSLPRSVTTAVPLVDERKDGATVVDLFETALAHVRAVDPGALSTLLLVSSDTEGWTVDAHRGGDRYVHHRYTKTFGQSEPEVDNRDDARTRNIFTDQDFVTLNIRDVVARTSDMFPKGTDEVRSIVLRRLDADAGRALRLRLNMESGVVVEVLPDGTVAPWWDVIDVAETMRQVVKVVATQWPPGAEAMLSHFRFYTSSTQYGTFDVEANIGEEKRKIDVDAGKFPVEGVIGPADSTPTPFAVQDIDPTRLRAILDDAARRLGVDDVDRRELSLTIFTRSRPNPSWPVARVEYRHADSEDSLLYELRTGQYLGAES
ncbi:MULTISPECIES: hypothetical protein [Mycobacteroides]|nr:MULTISPECIES: hypothetical protein [Mycobacteroides]AYM42146.1 hypothetical protein DYE20_11795 [[Mycobacterium] chelonae subsp. gwanakae]MBE5493148.1 hypothetical protein [Mycobacteroides abscessus]MDM2421036.1 hypothetical protein [Mycobacteroides abscessus]MDM2426093.1 hypothetical protein [Mycobacteroides abscessus]MDM2430962.1 hypothetical protein [Mycobacteroides abscessus]